MENGAYTFSPLDPLAKIFDEHRQRELDADHTLVDNYSLRKFPLEKQEQLTMYVENNVPTMFSTIYRQDWWTPGCYRILNRTWKNPRTLEFNKHIYEGIYASTISQLEWCKKQPGFRAAFMTRENKDGILRAIATGFKKRGYIFSTGHRIWTCKGSKPRCYQYAIIYGDDEIVSEWPYSRKVKD
jgi:hypothetical protein